VHGELLFKLASAFDIRTWAFGARFGSVLGRKQQPILSPHKTAVEMQQSRWL